MRFVVVSEIDVAEGKERWTFFFEFDHCNFIIEKKVYDSSSNIYDEWTFKDGTMRCTQALFIKKNEDDEDPTKVMRFSETYVVKWLRVSTTPTDDFANDGVHRKVVFSLKHGGKKELPPGGFPALLMTGEEEDSTWVASFRTD